MIDRGLIAAATKAVESKPRHFVTPAILLAVVLQESHGVPYFTDTKPGSQFKMNVFGAMSYTKHYRRPDGTKTSTTYQTGLKESDIRRMTTIEKELDKWEVPAVMAGQLAKFRFEYSYWERYSSLPTEKRFLMSCSWGLAQFMGPNITKPDKIDFIRRFRADVPMQLLYAAGMIDELLERTNGDVNRMYRAYNSGDADSEDLAVLARAKSVATSAEQIKSQLGS